MTKKVALVADSTAYIPDEWIQKFGVEVVPLVVIWGNEEIRDYYEIKAPEFFTRLSTAKDMPTTSQPTPAAFKAVFEKLHANGYDILAVLISEKLSGTFASAVQAKAMLPDANIELVDTASASMGEGWPLLMALRAAQAGKSLAECKAIVEEACKHTYVALTPDTLEFLHRGGRIGGAQRLLGSALNLKPLLDIQDGRIESVEKIRTRKKALNSLVDLVVEKAGDQRPVYIAALHANSEDDARYVLDAAAEKLNAKEKLITFVSPVIGTHTGPGTVGLAIMAGYDFE